MIYDKLNEIPMTLFVKVFLGDLNALVKNGSHSDEELSSASKTLIQEYLSICGGSGVLSDIMKRNNLLNHSSKVRCMEICLFLIESGNLKDVIDVLETFGYSVKEDRPEIEQRVKAVLANSKYNIHKILSAEKPESKEAITDDYFAREKAMLMSHYKMAIDSNMVSAKEYAYLIKEMCREIEQMNVSLRKR